MGSLNGESLHDLDKESLFSPEKEAQNESGSCSGGSRASGNVMLKDVYKSIKTVVFSNKLNLLIPFGPLAILVKKLSGHHNHVS